MQTIIITDAPEHWSFLSEFAPIISSGDYINADEYYQNKSLKVINLCYSYHYQSISYYISLLAQAREHKAFPSVHGIQDVLNMGLKLIPQEIHEELQKSLREIKTDKFVLSVFFGQNMAKKYVSLAKKLHNLFPLPLIQFTMEFKGFWSITEITCLSYMDIPVQHLEFMQQAAKDYLARKKTYPCRKKTRFHDLAMLADTGEINAPSNKKSLNLFIAAGEELGINVELIDKHEGKAIGEFDALFIRATTSVNHYTYRIARKAAQENLVVIDDPQSIIKCTNKIYLAELLQTHKILTPRTTFFNKHDKNLPKINFPCILKKPDSAFSLGVIKIDNEPSLHDSLTEFFKTSDLILAQPFIPTEYDWRIGVLDNKPLFACRYFMAKDHWQIYDWDNTNREKKEGKCEAVPLSEVPKEIIKLALKSTKFIGDGLYGVDIKSQGSQHYVIEINDNPNIDHGNEDKILGEQLYYQIMSVFLQRIRRKHGYV